MKIKFKKLHKDAVLPSYAKPGDAGLDLTTICDGFLTVEDGYHFVEYDIGLAVEIPEGYAGFIFPRSSASKAPLIQANCVGVIDSGYRGSIKVRCKVDAVSFAAKFGASTRLSEERLAALPIPKKGERVAQLIIMPVLFIEPKSVKKLSETDRGEGGFGSSGK